LTVAQIYLKSNPLLREPLTVADIKPRLLGHWGTSPGLSMVYTLRWLQRPPGPRLEDRARRIRHRNRSADDRLPPTATSLSRQDR